MVISRHFSNPLILSVLIVSFFVYSHFICVPEKKSFSSVIPQNEIKTVSGIVVSSPSKVSSGKYYSAQMEFYKVSSYKMNSDAAGRTRVFLPSEYIESFYPGKLYTAGKGKDLIESGTEVQLRGSFSDGVFFAREVLWARLDNNKNSRIRIVRAMGRLKFKRMMYSWGNAGGLLLALLSGSREYTETKVAENFKKAGLSHILALSGMHLSMFSGLALFLGSRIGRKRIALILQLTAVILFVWFAGLSPSLLRAFICLSVMLFQGIINIEKSDMFTVLCFSFFVQTLISPNDLMNTGFILSYGALCGITVSAEFFRKLYSYVFPGKISGALAASTGAQLVTLPVSAGLFRMITPIGIISSVFVSPLVTLFIYSGLLFIVLGLLFQPFVSIGEFIMKIQYNLISNMVSFFAEVPAVMF